MRCLLQKILESRLKERQVAAIQGRAHKERRQLHCTSKTRHAKAGRGPVTRVRSTPRRSNCRQAYQTGEEGALRHTPHRRSDASRPCRSPSLARTAAARSDTAGKCPKPSRSTAECLPGPRHGFGVNSRTHDTTSQQRCVPSVISTKILSVMLRCFFVCRKSVRMSATVTFFFCKSTHRCFFVTRCTSAAPAQCAQILASCDSRHSNASAVRRGNHTHARAHAHTHVFTRARVRTSQSSTNSLFSAYGSGSENPTGGESS